MLFCLSIEKSAYSSIVRFFILFSLLILPSVLFAQDVPPGSSPGAEAERFQVESEKKKEAFEQKKTKPPEIKVEEEAAPMEEKGPAFMLNDIEITGSTIFKEQDLKSCYESYIGKEIYSSDLAVIVQAIKNAYKSKGYLTTVAFVPEQDLSKGIIEIRVIEGKMGDLVIEGNKWFSAELIKKYFHVKKTDLLNVNTLQKDIVRLSQNPDLEIKTVLKAGLAPGTTDIAIQVDDKLPYHIGAGVDNKGSRLTGKWRTYSYLRTTNFIGFNDALYYNALFNQRSLGHYFKYEFPLDTYGTKLGFDFASFDMKLGKEFKSLDIMGHTRIYEPSISWELFLSEDVEISANSGISIKDVKKKTQGATTTEDKLRLLYIGLDVTRSDDYLGGSYTMFSPKVTFSSSSTLGGSSYNEQNASRTFTGGFFVKGEYSFSHIHRAPFNTYVSLTSQGQISSDTLPSSEQFQVGGADSVRGYPEGDYMCDEGAFLQTELILPMVIFPEGLKLPHASTNLANSIKPFLFTDIGGGRVKIPMSGEMKSKHLLGAGGGIKFNIYDLGIIKVQWAKDLSDAPTHGVGPSTFYLSFQSEI